MNTGDIIFIVVTLVVAILLNLIRFGSSKGKNLIPGIPPLRSRRSKYRVILAPHNLFYSALTNRKLEEVDYLTLP